MSIGVWSNKLSIGVKFLDDQHALLFETIKDLHSSIVNCRGRSVIGTQLHTLVAYTRAHFAAEEVMMKAANYPALATHRIRHHELNEQMQEYVTCYESSKLNLSSGLSIFLSEWLTNHIQGIDKQYGPWMSDHGTH